MFSSGSGHQIGGLPWREAQAEGKSLKVYTCSNSLFYPSVAAAWNSQAQQRPWPGTLAASVFLEFPLCKQLEDKHHILAFTFRLEVYPAFLFFLATGGVFHPVSDATAQVCRTELHSCSNMGRVGGSRPSPSGSSSISENVGVKGLVQGNHEYLKTHYCCSSFSPLRVPWWTNRSLHSLQALSGEGPSIPAWFFHPLGSCWA